MKRFIKKYWAIVMHLNLELARKKVNKKLQKKYCKENGIKRVKMHVTPLEWSDFNGLYNK